MVQRSKSMPRANVPPPSAVAFPSPNPAAVCFGLPMGGSFYCILTNSFPEVHCMQNNFQEFTSLWKFVCMWNVGSLGGIFLLGPYCRNKPKVHKKPERRGCPTFLHSTLLHSSGRLLCASLAQGPANLGGLGQGKRRYAHSIFMYLSSKTKELTS